MDLESLKSNFTAWSVQYFRIAWQLYLYRADRNVLAEHFSSLCALADYYTSQAKDHLIDFGLSDWLCPAPKGTWFGSTPLLYSSCHYYELLGLLQKIAEVLGEDSHAGKSGDLAGKVRAAIQKKLFHAKTGAYGEKAIV